MAYSRKYRIGERKPKNPSERLLYDKLTREGWTVTKEGCPDFACFKGDEFMLVEVKPKRGYRLKEAQYKLMSALSKRGIECYQWNPADGFMKVVPLGDATGKPSGERSGEATGKLSGKPSGEK